MSLPLQHNEALQDILALPEPARTQRIHDWVDEYDAKHAGEVLIRSSRKKGIRLPVGDGEWFNVPPSGRRVSRRFALKMLLEYGPGSSYVGRDMATGISQSQYATMHPDVKKVVDEMNRINNHTLSFLSDFVIHVPDAAEPTAPSTSTSFDYSDFNEALDDLDLEDENQE